MMQQAMAPTGVLIRDRKGIHPGLLYNRRGQGFKLSGEGKFHLRNGWDKYDVQTIILETDSGNTYTLERTRLQGKRQDGSVIYGSGWTVTNHNTGSIDRIVPEKAHGIELYVGRHAQFSPEWNSSEIREIKVIGDIKEPSTLSWARRDLIAA